MPKEPIEVFEVEMEFIPDLTGGVVFAIPANAVFLFGRVEESTSWTFPPHDYIIKAWAAFQGFTWAWTIDFINQLSP